MKVRHKTHGMVVEVPQELDDYTPDRAGIDHQLAAKGKPQPTPWFRWAQWEQVPDNTPVTHPASEESAPEAKSTAAKATK